MTRSQHTLLYLILTTLLLSACADDRRVVSLLEQAETLMDSLPDSAYTLLKACDSTIPEQSEKTRMRYWLLMADANNKLYQPLPSDTLFREVVDYYDHHGTPNQQLKAHYLLGCIYRDREEAPMALQCYQDAVEKADTLSPDCDYTTLYKVYGQMDEVLGSQVMPLEKIEALEQYSKYALKAGNIYEHIRGIECMSSAYDMLEDTAMILYTEKRAHDLYIQHGFKAAAASAYVMTMTFYVESGQFHKAAPLMLRFESESGLFDQDGNICKGREHYYYIKGTYYQGVHQLDSAEYYFRRLLTYNDSYVAYRGLMGVKMEKGQADSVIYFAQKRETAFNTFVSNIHAQATRQALGMYNYTRQQRIAEQMKADAEKKRMIILVMSIVCIIIATFLYLLYARSKAKRKKEVGQISQQLSALSIQYQKAQDELNSISDLDAYKTRKQQELTELQIQLNEAQERYNNLRQKEKFDALMGHPAISSIKESLKSFKPLTEAEWRTLSETIKQYMPMLHNRLMDGPVSGTIEQRVAILTRLEFRSDDIAILLNISKQSVSNARASVNKKLFLDNSARTLFNNLTHL